MMAFATIDKSKLLVFPVCGVTCTNLKVDLMETVLIVIHLMVVFALVVVVLLQRSEGGALGMGGGGGGGGGGFMSARGAANALTKTTALLAATFFATSIALGIYANVNESSVDVLDNVQSAPVGDGTSILDQITPENERAQDPENPSVPTGN